jgi:hypothetical protein
MGAEFILKKSRRIRQIREWHKRRLAGELPPIVDNVPVANFRLIDEKFGAEKLFEVCTEDGILKAFQERNLIGFVKDADTPLYKKVQESGGRAIGKFDRHLKRSGILCLEIQILAGGQGRGQIGTNRTAV